MTARANVCFRLAGAAQGRFGPVQPERDVRSQRHVHGHVSERGFHAGVGDDGEQCEKVSRPRGVFRALVIRTACARARTEVGYKCPLARRAGN